MTGVACDFDCRAGLLALQAPHPTESGSGMSCRFRSCFEYSLYGLVAAMSEGSAAISREGCLAAAYLHQQLFIGIVLGLSGR